MTLEWLTDSRKYNQLHIIVAENGDEKEAIEEVAILLEERIEQDGYLILNSNIPEPGEHWNTYAYDALTIILSVLGTFSLLLSAFLVVNTINYCYMFITHLQKSRV